MNKIVNIRSKGKIYIAGEYAVVNGGSAIIFPIDKYIIVTLAEDTNYYIFSHKYHKKFKRLDLNSGDKETLYIVRTINWFNRYLKELGVEEKKYKIEIQSELDNSENIKYGFGSSAAITITMLKALFLFYNIRFDELTLFKAGVMIQSKISKYTSCGDLACIAFGNKIYYRMFNEKVFELFERYTIKEILEIEWEDLIIEELDLIHKFLIVNTKETANSYELVEEVLKYSNTKDFKLFKETSDSLVLSIKDNQKDLKKIIGSINDNLRFLEKITHTKLYTEEMESIDKIIKKYNGSFKFSGAGGGDNVMCFFDDITSLYKAKEELLDKGFELIVYNI